MERWNATVKWPLVDIANNAILLINSNKLDFVVTTTALLSMNIY